MKHPRERIEAGQPARCETPRLVLASGSPRRRELLSEAGYTFEVIVPDESIECGVRSREDPAALVSEAAYGKAASVRKRITGNRPPIIVACDTIVECQGQILGKPRNLDDARQMLEVLRGREHRVYSGLCVWHVGAESHGAAATAGSYQPAAGTCNGNHYEVRVAVTRLRMDSLTDQQLNDYLESRAWEGKAGAFGYQDRLGWVHVIEGSESNVVGLPLELLEAMLSAAGYRVKRPTLAPDLRATRSRGDHGAIMTDASQDEPRQVMVRRLFPDGIPALWCPPITHYQADGRIDRVRIEAHLRYIAPYVRGLLVPGSTGDAWEMNDQEWHEILSFVVELAVEINACVLVGALESTAEATEALIRDTLCRFEQRAGMVCTSRQDTLDLLSRYRVCGFVVCGPQGDGMSQGQLFDGLQQILDLGVPTALYQLPQVTCNEIAPETAAALADRFVNFYLLKDSSGQDRIALSQACPRGVFLVRGAEGDYAQMLAAGGGPYHGLLLSSANCFAPQLAALMENLAEGRMAEAQRISRNLSAAVHDAFALVARLPYGNAFANANKAMDHIMAYGNAALRNEPPLLHAGVRIPREIIEATAGVLAGYGLMPQEGYLSS